MRFLVDENVPDTVADFLRERGHEVHLARETIPQGAADPLVAKAADVQDAIVVTMNAKDFKKLIGRVTTGRALRLAGRINIHCREPIARRRFEELMDSIEFEWQQCQKRKDKRFFANIATTSFSFVR